MMCKKLLALACALVMALSLGTAALAESEEQTASRPEAEVVEGERYISAHLEGASALYVAGEQVTLDDAYFYGAGYASDQQITDQLPNQYGLCAVVLAAGQDTVVTLNNPIIESDPESYANGVFAAAMAKITVNGGSIDTDNSSGHGIDGRRIRNRGTDESGAGRYDERRERRIRGCIRNHPGDRQSEWLIERSLGRCQTKHEKGRAVPSDRVECHALSSTC